MRFRLWTLSLVVGSLILAGCANYAAPFETRPAHPGLRSAVAPALDALPPPREKVTVAVYRFRDQTGQYKAAEQGSSFSTAVTQGATSILMRALDASGWFVTIEREGLSNLLNERQIIQQIRQQHQGPNGEQLGPLPPLLYAGVMLEGGIVGYDTNVMTGGAGVRYFGIGGSGEYRQDQVTIYLRAVSTQSGRVLKTVHTTKTILSQKVDGGAFLFVDQDRLLETEAGYSFNEPPVLAVTEAIDEAVRQLVLEGIQDGLWHAQSDDTEKVETLLAAYETEKARAHRRDAFDRLRMDDPRPGLGIGATFGLQRYHGDYHGPKAGWSGALRMRGMAAPRWGVDLTLSAGEIIAADVFREVSAAADLGVTYLLLPGASMTPYLHVGGGVRTRTLSDPTQTVLPQVAPRVGLEAMLTPRLALDVSTGAHYTLGDDLDGVAVGRYEDSVWTVRAGMTVYTGFF